jgi:DNA repair protein RecO (recombination protein O)
MVLFLSEVLSFCIQEEENNDLLYEYLENSLIWLDTHGKIANFHLLFLLNLTQFLGFYPDVSKKNTLAFDLLEGNFTDAVNGKDVVSGNDFYQFKKLLNLNFNEIEQVSFGKAERQKVLQLILKFYSLHLDGFRNPKSLAIFETVFR